MRLRRWEVVSVGPRATPGWRRKKWTEKGAREHARQLNVDRPEGILFQHRNCNIFDFEPVAEAGSSEVENSE